MLNIIMAVGIGGFIGAILRIFTINIINKFLPHSISFGTLFINIIDSFIIGFLFFYAQNNGLTPLLKSFISTGFLGALPLFLPFLNENLILLQSGDYINFTLNILL